ncbi:hypothetical protein SRHO_G00100650 [Serrasalmus rhombeus]
MPRPQDVHTEIPVSKVLLRIILSKDDIRKIHTDSEPETLDSFHSFLKCKLGLHRDFVVQFQDPDFGNEFCNLTSLSELPKEKATLKVILKQTPESPRTDSTLDTASLSSLSSSSLEDTPTCRRLWPDPFVTPQFSYDVELKLKRGNEAFQESGTLLNISKDTKSEILDKLAEEMYKYSAYPSPEQHDLVAQSLVKKHPCLREPGSVKGWYCWKFSLQFKMGNYRNKLRVSGCSELKVNCRNSGPKQKLKKAKKAEVSFLPDIPEGKTQNVLEEERAAIVAEMKKKRVDWKKVTDMMASTFSLRRKEIVEQPPLVAEVKARWPALFTDEQTEAEFARLTSTDLWATFVSGLDQYLERFLQMFRAKSHCIQTLSSLLSLLDDDAKTLHQTEKEGNTVALKCGRLTKGPVTWSRDTNGQRVDILTTHNGETNKHIADPDRRYDTRKDPVLIIYGVSQSDAGRYDCSGATVELSVTSGTGKC